MSGPESHCFEELPPQGLPEHVFKAWYEWNMRLPQVYFGITFGVLAAILRHGDKFEEVCAQTFSERQIAFLEQMAKRAHDKRSISPESLNKAGHMEHSMNFLWKQTAGIMRQMITALLNENEPARSDEESASMRIDISPEQQDALRQVFELAETALASPPVSKILTTYRNFFDRTKNSDMHTPEREKEKIHIMISVTEVFIAQLEASKQKLQQPLPITLLDRLIKLERAQLPELQEQLQKLQEQL